MGFEKISNVSLTDLFVQQIENMILSGELEVGEQLPPARELSIQMGVSRPVISAGLIELEKLGFVEIIPRKGAFVCDYRRKGTVETLVAIMRYNGGAMRKNEVISLLQVREALECLTVQLVIEHTTKEEMKSLEKILNEIHENDCKMFIQLGAGFGRVMLMIEMLEGLLDKPFLAKLLKADRITASPSELPNVWDPKRKCPEITVKDKEGKLAWTNCIKI